MMVRAIFTNAVHILPATLPLGHFGDVRVCVCLCERKRERETEVEGAAAGSSMMLATRLQIRIHCFYIHTHTRMYRLMSSIPKCVCRMSEI